MSAAACGSTGRSPEFLRGERAGSRKTWIGMTGAFIVGEVLGAKRLVLCSNVHMAFRRFAGIKIAGQDRRDMLPVSG